MINIIFNVVENRLILEALKKLRDEYYVLLYMVQPEGYFDEENFYIDHESVNDSYNHINEICRILDQLVNRFEKAKVKALN